MCLKQIRKPTNLLRNLIQDCQTRKQLGDTYQRYMQENESHRLSFFHLLNVFPEISSFQLLRFNIGSILDYKEADMGVQVHRGQILDFRRSIYLQSLLTWIQRV